MNEDVAPLERTALLVKTYTESLLAIRRWQADLVAFCRSVCETNLEFRQLQGETQGERAQEAMSQTLDTMLEQAGVGKFLCQNLLTAQLLKQPAAELRATLEKGLRKAVRTFGHHVTATLGRMVSAESVGLIEWTAPNVCCYHFFKEVVLQTHDGTKVIAGNRRRRPEASSLTGWVRTDIDRKTGSHEFRHARHEHHVLHAFHTSIRDSKVVIPPAVQRLVNSVPDWLYEFVRIIDGDIFRQRVIEGVRRRETWVQDQPRDVPVFGCEPAVVIDEFVLTGWGPEVVAAELARRKSMQQALVPTGGQHEWRLWHAGAAIGAIATFALEVSGHSFGSLLLAGATLFAAVQTVRAFGVSQNVPSGPLQYLAGIWLTIGLLTACALVASGSLLKIFAGVVVAVACTIALPQMKRLWPATRRREIGSLVKEGHR